MSAEEIKFPPAERRDPRRFDPPPWEQDQFDELRERTRMETPPEAVAEDEAVSEAASGQTIGAQPAPTAEPGERPGGAAGRPDSPADAGVVEAPEVKAMLAQLAAEERTDERPIRTVSVVSGVLLAVIGCVLIVWAVAAFVVSRRAGAVGAFGGAVLLLFGAGFVAGGMWIGTRHLR